MDRLAARRVTKRTGAINLVNIMPWNERGVCSWCGLEPEGGIERDHIVELWDGGRDAPFNLMNLCHNCHKRKMILSDGTSRVDARLFLIETAMSQEHWRHPTLVYTLTKVIRRSLLQKLNEEGTRTMPLTMQLSWDLYGRPLASLR